MKLHEYLNKMPINKMAFARQLGISTVTLYSIINGADPKLSVALKIESLTQGKVTCKDLAPGSIKTTTKRKTNNQRVEKIKE